jgi:hypothetical protein
MLMVAHKLVGNNDDPRGGECVKLNLLGDYNKKKTWRAAVLLNLGLKTNDLDGLGFLVPLELKVTHYTQTRCISARMTRD